MLTVFLRTIVIYIFLTVTMRVMGKRQLGELDVGEFVITILLSEIASLPITNSEKNLLDAIIPIATLAGLEILSSTLILKFPKLKNVLSSKPSVIIAHGKLDKKEMRRVRISVEDLVSQIRQNGIFEIDEVDYAILEENGKMSIIPKARNRQPDMSDLNLETADTGFMHIIVSDGVVNTHTLKTVNLEETRLIKLLSSRSVSLRDVLCMTINDAGNLYIIKNDGSSFKIQKCDV